MDMCNEAGCIVIRGVRHDGAQFRPGDWIERLAAGAGRFDGDGRLRHSPWVKPALIEGERCLVVSVSLASREFDTYQWIMGFVQDNHLATLQRPLLSTGCPPHSR